jgi:hypothetical protein
MSSRIVYNSKTITFPRGGQDFHVDYLGARLISESPADIAETLNVGPSVLISAAFRDFQNSDSTHATFKRNIYQWFEWARKGGAFTFAKDSSKVSSTILAGGSLAGSSTLLVSSASGLTIGDQCILRSDTNIELIKIQNLVGTTITTTETLNNDWASGSVFRHEFYWNARLQDYRRHCIVDKIVDARFDVELLLKEDWS